MFSICENFPNDWLNCYGRYLFVTIFLRNENANIAVFTRKVLGTVCTKSSALTPSPKQGGLGNEKVSSGTCSRRSVGCGVDGLLWQRRCQWRREEDHHGRVRANRLGKRMARGKH